MRLGALVPIRLSSERLPGKALAHIGGRPAVTHLIERLAASRYLTPQDIVICTTRDTSDDPLVPVVEAAGARVYRGSRDDLIERFHGAVSTFGFDAVIQADGDDPFTDTGYMDRCLNRLLADEQLDIVLSEGLPIGLNSKAIRARAIEHVLEHRVTEKNDHGFILLFTATGLCTTAVIRPTSALHEHPTARITLDYPEDLAFFNALHAAIGERRPPFGVEEIVTALKAQPSLLEINTHLNDAYRQRTGELLNLQYRRDGRIFDVEVSD